MDEKNKNLSGAAARTGELNKKYYKNIQKERRLRYHINLRKYKYDSERKSFIVTRIGAKKVQLKVCRILS